MSEMVRDARRPFGSVITAMVTPMAPDGRLDLDAAAALATHLAEHGHDGLVLNGTTGESSTTTEQEKTELIRVVRDAVGDDMVLLAGAGSNDTEHSVMLARDAADLGVDGILVVTPYYNKPPQAGLVAHFEAVADASELPIMVYDIPSRSGVPITYDTLMKLADHPKIVAVKDAKCDLFEASKVMAGTDLAWYSGADEFNLPLLSLGAVGMVSVVGHLVGDQMAAMVKAVNDGDIASARSINNDLLPIIEAVMMRTQGVIAVKTALHQRGVLPHPTMRLPLVPAEPELADELMGLSL